MFWVLFVNGVVGYAIVVALAVGFAFAGGAMMRAKGVDQDAATGGFT